MNENGSQTPYGDEVEEFLKQSDVIRGLDDYDDDEQESLPLEWLNQSYRILLTVDTGDDQRGTLEISKKSGYNSVTIPTVGFSRSEKSIRGRVGWQVFHLNDEEYTQFLYFCFQSKPFEVTQNLNELAAMTMTGVVNNLDPSDFSPTPRIQITVVTYDLDNHDKKIVDTVEVLYLELTEANRNKLREALDNPEDH